MNTEKMPLDYIGTDRGKIIIIAGEQKSGKSTLIRSCCPTEILIFKPQFKSDKKSLIDDLNYVDPDSLVGIETNLPSIIQNPDIFLKELTLLGRLKKHTYIIEWKVDSVNYSSFLYSTYSKYIKTVIMTHGIKKDTDHAEDVINRFAAIGSQMNPSDSDWIIEYSVLKHDGSPAIETERSKYNISNWI